jgi:hypothetical protein
MSLLLTMLFVAKFEGMACCKNALGQDDFFALCMTDCVFFRVSAK